MNHRTMIGAVARHFPDLTQRQIEAVLEVMVEVWRQALVQSEGEITLRDFGKLKVEIQHLRPSGIVRKQAGGIMPTQLTRVYIRFRPTRALRSAIENRVKEEQR